jgi:hypothetical protein
MQMALRDTASDTELMVTTSAGENHDDMMLAFTQSGVAIGKLV